MCFLPLGCLKFIVGLGAAISIFISLGLLVLTIIANKEKQQIISNTGTGIITDVLVGLYLAAAIFMVLGICGVYGAMKSRKKQKGAANCLLSIYFIGVLFFFLVFLGGTIFFFVGPKTLFGQNCERGGQITLVEDLYKLNVNASNPATGLCSPACQCYLAPANVDSALGLWLVAQGKNFTTNAGGKNNYTSCVSKEEADSANFALMAALEKLVDCGSWCENDPMKINRFTDLNECASDQCLSSRKGCFKAFQDFLTGKGKIIGFACAIALGVSFLNMLTICSICYHPEKRNKGKNFYQRMNED